MSEARNDAKQWFDDDTGIIQLTSTDDLKGRVLRVIVRLHLAQRHFMTKLKVMAALLFSEEKIGSFLVLQMVLSRVHSGILFYKLLRLMAKTLTRFFFIS
jgi:hypothetical protein